jgi:hypothetical protein
MNGKNFLLKIGFLLILFIVLDCLISTVLINGLNKYYGINQKPDVLINGTSVAMSGFNRTDIEHSTKCKTANYSYEGVSVEERLAMIDHFFLENPKSVRTVIYEVNPVIFSDSRIADNAYTILYPYMDNNSIDRYIRGKASNKDYYLHKFIRTKRFESRLIRLVVSGYLGQNNNIKTSGLDTSNLFQLRNQKGEVTVSMEPEKIEIFEETMDLIKFNNADIILVMMPMYYDKLQSYNNAELEALKKYFSDFSKSVEGISFLDLNQDSLVRDPGLFFDPIHYNVFGQKKITNAISSCLTENSGWN